MSADARETAAKAISLLWCFAVAVYFIAALIVPAIPRPHGGLAFLFWAGGPCGIFMCIVGGYCEWAERWGDL